MNPLVKILCYLAGILLATCLLSPPAYWGCQWLIHEGWATALKGFPFHRYFDRVIQISALVLAWPTVRWLHIRSLGELNLQKNPCWNRDVLVGFATGIVPLLLLVGICMGLDIYHIRTDIAWGRLIPVIGATVAVPIMEEFFFRGVLLGLALKITSRWNAIFLVSIIFAVLHFLKPGKVDASPDVVTWMSGFQQLATVFSTIRGDPGLVLGGCATLLVAGVILGYGAVTTRSLWLGIGVHGAWIFGQQMLNLIARFRIKPPEAFLPWIGPSQVSGAVPVGIWPIVALLITAAFLYWYLNAKTPRKNSALP